MKLSNYGWKVGLGLAALLISFALGYWAGASKSVSRVEPNQALSSSDMEHAFGEIAAVANEKNEHSSTGNEAMAKSLSDLVAGLEQKVAANPGNIDQQLLLAQTYNELGSREKGLKLLRELSEKHPKDAQVKITLATVLMKGDDKKELQESLKVFDAAIKLNPETGKMAKMYQDEVRSHLKSM